MVLRRSLGAARVSAALPVLAALLLAGAPAPGAEDAPAGGEAQAEADEAAGSGGACADSVAATVQARYDRIRDLRAGFSQRSFHVAFGEEGSSSEAKGEVLFAKPGRMRWTYEAPEPSVVVSDGETLWIFDPDAGEVQVMHVGQGFLSGTAIQFLLGEGELRKAFEVRAEACGGERVRLILTPKEEATYERLVLEADPETGLVAATSIDDLFGNRTEVRFRDLETNTDPPASRFRFEPPEGTRVLELE